MTNDAVSPDEFLRALLRLTPEDAAKAREDAAKREKAWASTDEDGGPAGSDGLGLHEQQ